MSGKLSDRVHRKVLKLFEGDTIGSVHLKADKTAYTKIVEFVTNNWGSILIAFFSIILISLVVYNKKKAKADAEASASSAESSSASATINAQQQKADQTPPHVTVPVVEKIVPQKFDKQLHVKTVAAPRPREVEEKVPSPERDERVPETVEPLQLGKPMNGGNSSGATGAAYMSAMEDQERKAMSFDPKAALARTKRIIPLSDLRKMNVPPMQEEKEEAEEKGQGSTPRSFTKKFVRRLPSTERNHQPIDNDESKG